MTRWHVGTLLLLALVLFAPVASAAPVPSGPEIGKKLPEFNLPDQNGTRQDLQSIAGPKGAVIVFFRSADW